MIRKIFPILALSVFSSMLGAGLIAPLLPLYAEDMGASGIWIGVIFASFFISRTILMPIIGRLSDRNGRKLFICIGLLSYSIISLGYIWADNVLQLTLVRFIHGAAAGMIIPIAQAYVGDISPAGEEGRWMGYFHTAFFAGYGFGPLMGGVLTDHLGMDIAFFTMGGLNLLAFLIVAPFLPEIKREKAAASPNPSFKKMSDSSVIKGLFSFRLVDALGRGAFSCFLPIFAAIYIGLSPTLIGTLLATYILVTALFETPGGHIADRFNRKVLVPIGSLITLTFTALTPFAHSFWQLSVLCLFGGLGRAISLPAASALNIEEGRKFGMGSTMAVFTMAMSIGMAGGPLLGGVLADFVSISSVFYFAAGMSLIGTGLFVWFTK